MYRREYWSEVGYRILRNVRFTRNMLEYVMLCAVWYYFYNLENVKNTDRGVFLLVNCKN